MNIQEVCHSILKLKMYSSSYEVVTISLFGSRKAETVEGEMVLKRSKLDIYANRYDYSNNQDILNLNFVSFVSTYTLEHNQIVKRKKNVIIRIVPNYPSNPNGVYYYLHCKFSLLKFKVWRGNPSSAWDNLDDTDENYINCLCSFLKALFNISIFSVPEF